ncbi:hypothetical protein [Thermomonospora umbrina]|nr:hypothetical protein [Thermomonospora umbrina]
MRIVIAALIGVLMAGGVSVGATQLMADSSDDPVTGQLHNYGSR